MSPDKKCPYYNEPCIGFECHAYRENVGFLYTMDDYVVVIRNYPWHLSSKKEWWGLASKKNYWKMGACDIIKSMHISFDDNIVDMESEWIRTHSISDPDRRPRIHVSKSATDQEIVAKITELLSEQKNKEALA